MKIINIGILAHVDAGKTTLTESLLYASGAISEPGSVEKGTTRTDTMFLERQRGITIQAAVTSFQWHRCKVNIVDTPGHMDFLAEVYRSLAVLDGAILVISAKDGVQAQTRILFHALRKMNIPTVIFINKIDQAGVDLQSVVQSVRDKLSADIIIKQTVSLSPEIVLEENTDIEAWDAVIENNDKLLEKYIAGEPISREKLVREEQRRVQDASLFPVYYGSAKKGLGIQPLMDAVTGLFQPIGEQGSAALCGSVFKVEYTDCGQRRVYLRLYSGTLRLRDTVALAGREKLKITEMRIPSKGEIVRTDTAYPGEIVILPSDSVRLNDVLGDQTRLPRKRWREDPLPMLRTTIAPKTAAQRERLLDALTQQCYHVDKYGTIVVKGVHYSVPDNLVGKQVTVFLYCNKLVVYQGKEVVAEHEKTAVNGWKLDLMHYLRTFERKPGSVAGSTALSMASEELRDIFVKHFSNNPSDFILLLKKTKEKGLTLEDLDAGYRLMRDSGVTPSLQAFDLFLFNEQPNGCRNAQFDITSRDIETYANDSLSKLSALIESPVQITNRL